MTKALTKTQAGPGFVEFVERPDPRPGDDDLLVQIVSSAVCGTDVWLCDWRYKGRAPIPTPFVLGHEGAGVVVETGKDVRAITPGVRVGLEAIIGCCHCRDCLRGNPYLCQRWTHIGISADGVFAKLCAVPAAGAHRLPDSVGFDDATLLEPLAIIAHAFERVSPTLGETVAVVGPGPLGLLATMAARSVGASRVIAVGRSGDDRRLDAAGKAGADWQINGGRAEPVEAVLELTGGRGADVVFETGGTPESVGQAIAMAGASGRVAIIGFAPAATFDPLRLVRNDAMIVGVDASAPRHYFTALDWLEAGKVRPRDIISHRLPLADALRGIELARTQEATKVLLVG